MLRVFKYMRLFFILRAAKITYISSVAGGCICMSPGFKLKKIKKRLSKLQRLPAMLLLMQSGTLCETNSIKIAF